jgi:DNA modification methylase
MFQQRIFSCYKPCLLFTEGLGHNRRHWVRDIVKGGGKSKQFHKWEQAEAEFGKLIADYSSPGQLILDPFMGSGTTGAASLRLGRRFIGIEKDEQSFATCKARLDTISKTTSTTNEEEQEQ